MSRFHLNAFPAKAQSDYLYIGKYLYDHIGGSKAECTSAGGMLLSDLIVFVKDVNLMSQRHACPIKILLTLKKLLMKTSNENRHVIKRVRSHSKEKLYTDKRFQRVRDHWKDFTKAARYAKLMRTIMESIQQPVHDRSRHIMLTKRFAEIIKADDAAPGQRDIKPGCFHQLWGIELNTGISMEDLFIFSFSMIDFPMRDTTYYLDYTILNLRIKRKVLPPDVIGFEINIGLAEIDFGQLTFRLHQQSSGLMHIRGKRPAILKIETPVGPEAPERLFIFLALSFYDKDKQFKTGAITLVDAFPAREHVEYLSAIGSGQKLLPEAYSVADTAVPPETPVH